MASYTDNEIKWMAWHASKLQAAGYNMAQTNAIIASIRQSFDIQLESDLLAYFAVDTVTNQLGHVTYANQNIILNPKITIKRKQGVFDPNSAPDRFEEMLAKTLNDCLTDFYQKYQINVNNITNAVSTTKNAPFTLELTDSVTGKMYSLDILNGTVDTSLTYTINLISTDGINQITTNTTATTMNPIFIKMTDSNTLTTMLTAKGGTVVPSNNYTISYAPARTISERNAPFMLNLSDGINVYNLEITNGTVNDSLFYTVELISTDGITPISGNTTATTSAPIYVQFTDGTIIEATNGTVAPASSFAVSFSNMNYTVNAPFTLELTSNSLGRIFNLDILAGSYESNLSYVVTLISTDGVNPISGFAQATSTNPVYVKLTGSDGSVAILTAFGGTVDIANDFTIAFNPARAINELNAPFKLTLNTYELDITNGTVNTNLNYIVDTIYVATATVISGTTTATMQNPVYIRFTDGTTLEATYGTVDVDPSYTVAFGTSTVKYAPFFFTLDGTQFESVEGAVDTTRSYIVNLVSTDGINPIIINTSASILNPIFVDLDDGTRLKIVNGTVTYNPSSYSFAIV